MGIQTPWLSDIDGAGYRLLNVGQIGTVGITAPVSGIGVEIATGELRVSGTGAPPSGKGIEIWYTQNGGGIENYNYDTGQWEQLRINGATVVINGPWPDGEQPTPGFVGIGKADPQRPLDIMSAAGQPCYIFLDTPPATGGNLNPVYSGVLFKTAGTYVGEIGAWHHNLPGDGLAIDVGAFSNNIFIDYTSGYVGINNGSPRASLDVFGPGGGPLGTGGGANGWPVSITATDGSCYIRLDTTNPATYSGIGFYCGGQYIAEIGAWHHNDPGDGISIDVGVNNEGSIYLLESNGYVGIKCTPQYRLDVNGDINLTGQIRRNGVVIL